MLRLTIVCPPLRIASERSSISMRSSAALCPAKTVRCSRFNRGGDASSHPAAAALPPALPGEDPSPLFRTRSLRAISPSCSTRSPTRFV